MAPERAGRWQRLLKRMWWLHSFGALAFGVGVMLFARKGLEYADNVLIVLAISWLLVFLAFRFVVGPSNTSPDDKLAKRSLRLVANYVIKQLYQQMFFFLVPLYASSATWTWSSPNWWLVPILLICAVVSTMDLVFDHFIMQRRWLASSMYGLCVFAVLNLCLPLVIVVTHFEALTIAAGLAPPMVALLTFRISQIVSARGGLLLVLAISAFMGLALAGRRWVPPTPMAMVHAGIGHGAPGTYECVPGPVSVISPDRLEGLRCVTEIAEPGGVSEPVLHIWSHRGVEKRRVQPTAIETCHAGVLRSELSPTAPEMPPDPTGRWTCRVETKEGQLVGEVSFQVGAKAN